MSEIFNINEVTKIFGTTKYTKVTALDEVSINISKGEFVAIVGPSGSGKSTLLNVMSGLDSVTKGKVLLEGKDLTQMKGNQLSDYRRDHIGFIFQAYNLIPVLTVKENIEYVMLIQGIESGDRKQRVADILNEVGLSGIENRFPSELSGGQQQRVAVARAMVSKPSIILADEPTANLDSETGSALLDLMEELNHKHGVTFIFSTHDKLIMDRAKRLIVLKDGKVDKDKTV